MSWHPNDLVSDVDLTDYESSILTQFNVANWRGRRTKALEDWLFPALKRQGFDAQKLRTRFTCDAVWSFTASAYADRTAAAADTTEDDLNLATIFATPGTDALYIGSTEPFRGVFFRLLDSVSAVASVMSVAYWDGAWTALTVTDGTALVAGKTFSGGGSVTWTLPVDWVTRKVNTQGPYYWVKVTVSATPTSAKATQIGAIRSSALRAPVTFRTLELIFREAPTGNDGPWHEKAEYYRKEADDALQTALQICGGEFDTTTVDDLVDTTEAAATASEVSTGFVWERA